MDTNTRVVRRFPGQTIGPLQIRPNGKTFEAHVQDFSVLGAGILCEIGIPVGTMLKIEIERGAPGDPLSAEVRHATQRPDGQWLIGCRFCRLLTMEDIRQLESHRPAISLPW